MVRTYWNATLVAALALPALVWGQHVSTTAPAPAVPPEQMISVKEAGKPEQRCRILKVWKTPEGATARQVQALDTGEIMTIVEIGPGTAGALTTSAPASSGIVTRIFHWGHNQTAPAGVPAPPAMGGVVVSATPCNTCTPTFSGTPAVSGATVVSAPCPCQSGMPAGTVVSGPCTTCQQGTTFVTGNPVSGSSTVVTMPGSSTVVPAPTSGSSTVVSTSTQEHVPFWKHWFQREPYTIPTQPPAGMARYTSTTPSQTSVAQVPAKKPDDTSTASTTPAKKPVDVPQPTDWRRSWGKADLSQAQAPAKPATDSTKTQTADSSKTQPTDNSKKPATDKKTVAQQEPAKQLPATKPETSPAAKPTVATNTPKPPTTPGKDAPGSVKGMAMDLPRADAKKPDPLNTPDRYVSKELETKLKDPTSRPDAKKTAPKKTEVAVADNKESKDAKKKTEKVVDESSSAPGSSSTHPKLPLGAQSVLAAYEGKPGAVCYLPVPMVTLPASVPPGMTQPAEPTDKAPAQPPKSDATPANAFTAASNAPSDKMMANAFSSGAAQQQPMMNYPPAGMMMPPPMAMMPGMPMRPGMPGPVAQAGYMGPGGMVMPAYCVPGMMPGQPGMTGSAAYPMPSMPPAMPQPVAEMQNVGQLLLTMRDSVYPSYREWAAEALTASGNNHHNPQVVDALVAAAKDDPAASVRATCIRCLAKMHVNTAPAVTTIQGLKADPDPRVRSAAEQALTSLGIPQPADAPVQPASATAPADKAAPPAADPAPAEAHE